MQQEHRDSLGCQPTFLLPSLSLSLSCRGIIGLGSHRSRHAAQVGQCRSIWLQALRRCTRPPEQAPPKYCRAKLPSRSFPVRTSLLLAPARSHSTPIDLLLGLLPERRSIQTSLCFYSFIFFPRVLMSALTGEIHQFDDLPVLVICSRHFSPHWQFQIRKTKTEAARPPFPISCDGSEPYPSRPAACASRV